MRAALLALACVGTAQAETRPHYAGKLEAPLQGAPATFDPAIAQSHAELVLTELLFDTLYRIEHTSSGAEVIPHLAVTLPVPDKTRTTWRIELRRGVRFHDGKLLTALDVAASLDRARTGGGRWALAAISSVAVVNDAVELAVQAPVDVATMLALAPAAITRNGKPPGGKPIGTGAFKLDAIDRAAGKLVLEAFDEHFAGRPYLDRLTLRWHSKPDGEARRFELDDAQLSTRGASSFVGGQPKYRASFKEGPQSLLLFVGFGRKHAAVTGDRAFRRALDLALDRNALTTLFRGETVTPAGEPLPGIVPTPLVRFGDLAQAKAALADAARRVPALQAGRLGDLALDIAFEDTRPDDRAMAERVARALDKLGIAATLSALSAQELLERVQKGTTDLWIGQLVAPYTAEWTWWTAAFGAGGDDWAITRLLAGQLTTAAARAEHAARRPIVPLVFRAIRMWHRTDVKGLRFDVTGRPCFAELFLFGSPVKSKP